MLRVASNPYPFNKRRIVLRVYRILRFIVGGIVAAWALLAILIILESPSWRVEAQQHFADEISDESRHYCTKWGFAIGTHAYSLCVIDLAEIRRSEDDRVTFPWP